jgi:hypothetical protein
MSSVRRTAFEHETVRKINEAENGYPQQLRFRIWQRPIGKLT